MRQAHIPRPGNPLPLFINSDGREKGDSDSERDFAVQIVVFVMC